MIATNPPTKSIINLSNKIKNWKIIVIANSKNIDMDWIAFKNSTNLKYLSIKTQNKLGFIILKFLPKYTHGRKIIGYLYAIQHGAKEIYEIDENLMFPNENLNYLDYNINNSYVCYGIQNGERMINPYAYFGEENLWPRGFFIRDIMKNKNTCFNIINSNLIKLKPLIYQGLINGIPDLDSLLVSTIGKNIINLNITFNKNYPLVYIPGNFVPINSKNTKYLYDVFPFLMFPIFVNENIADILRGYLIQFFVYEYGGTIVFHNSYVYNSKLNFNGSRLIDEKEIFFELNNFLKIIKESKSYIENNPLKLLFHILNELIEKNFLLEQEINIYKAYLQDLSNIGYIYSSQFFRERINNYNFLDLSIKHKFYSPQNQNILSRNNIKDRLLRHSSSTKIYNDILLIINYNRPGFLKLINYLEKLYKKYFPNIVYIYPEEIENKSFNIITCNESYIGFYSYNCIKNIYSKFPNFKGYFLINDDVYVKSWELENFDFTIPWLYLYGKDGIKKNWYHYPKCLKLYEISNKNLDWKINLTKFFGRYDIYNGLSDLYYIPISYISKFIELSKKMYASRIFLECAIPTIFSVIYFNRSIQILIIYLLRYY